MMISHQQVARAAQAYLGEIDAQGRRGPAGAATGGTGGADGVVISRRAQDVRRWTEALRSMPDGDEDRVARLASEVASGKYHPGAADIADQILARSLADRLGGAGSAET